MYHKWEMQTAYSLILREHERKRPLQRPTHRWEIILIYIIRKYGVSVWTGLNWPRIGSSGGLM